MFEFCGGGVAGGGGGGGGLGGGDVDVGGGGEVGGGDFEVDGGEGSEEGGSEVEAGGGVGDGELDPPLPPHAERKPALANTMKSRRFILFFMAFFLNHAFLDPSSFGAGGRFHVLKL